MSAQDFVLSLRRGPGTWMRVLVNGIPVIDRPHVDGTDHYMRTLNELVGGGDNDVDFEIHRVTGRLHEAFFVEGIVYRPGQQALPLVHVGYPHPIYPARRPVRVATRFEADRDLVAPLFFDAAPAPFGCEGTADMRELVLRLHRAYGRGDAAEVARLLGPKRRHDHVAYDRAAPMAPSTIEAFDRSTLGDSIAFAPLDEADLHVEPLRGGAVAAVTRRDGRPVIDGRYGWDDSVRAVTLQRVLVAHLESGWTIV